jgi:hypothetical protein
MGLENFQLHNSGEKMQFIFLLVKFVAIILKPA